MRLLKVPEIAQRLGLHPVTVYKILSAGKLPTVRIGRAVRVSETALAEHIEKLTTPAR